jgi:hypothetical protein
MVRLGRVTEVETLEDGRDAPVGQKLLLVDGEECRSWSCASW